jgi:hypothetical protein
VLGPGGVLHEIDHTGPGRSGTWTCHYYATEGGGDGTGFSVYGPPIAPTTGQVVALMCWDESGNLTHSAVFVFDPADPVPGIDDPAQAAALAEQLLPVALPQVETSPPVGAGQLVGVPTWLWVGNAWRPLEASATLDGVTATVTATPTSVSWVASDGQHISCSGPGTAYDPAKPVDAQHSRCTLLFEDAGPLTLTATIAYTVRWTSNTGDAGGLPTVTRTSTVITVVHSAQAVIH